jgi:acyl-CoA synthetase (AMP-forming)/AMP-acid ligase II
MQPGYGLAERTLIVTGECVDAPPIIASFNRDALDHGHAKLTQPNDPAPSQRLVASGSALGEQEVAIVDPARRTRCRDGEVGEIWLRGASVAKGYWGKLFESERVFHARIAEDGDPGPYLRSGDLGFLRGDELFVTGRMKEVMIINGRNLYPQDLEATAEQSHPGLRLGCAAAFALDVDDQERAVIVQEVDPAHEEHVAAMATAIRQAVSSTHQVPLHAVALIKRGTLHKTSSGKVQRVACRQQFVQGTLQYVALPEQVSADQMATSAA